MKHTLSTHVLVALASFGTVACSQSKADVSPDKQQTPTVVSAAKPGPAAKSKPSRVAAKAAPAASTAVNVRDYTSAPKQVEIVVKLRATPEAVWALLSDHEALPSFIPAIQKVTVDHSKARTRNGVGTTRECSLMGMELTESIRVFEPNRALGYSVVKGGMPGVRNHLGLIRLAADGDHTIVRWQQYFDHPQPKAIAQQIKGLLTMAADGLIKKFGGDHVRNS